jgi:hypothetical protein
MDVLKLTKYAPEIEELTRTVLRTLGHDASGWDTLFVDPADDASGADLPRQ